MPNNWIANRFTKRAEQTHRGVAEIRREQEAQRNAGNREYKINRLLENQPTGARAAIAETLGLAQRTSSNPNRQGGAFHSGSAEAQKQLEANQLERTNNPTVNRFSALRAIRRFRLVNDFDEPSDQQLRLVEDEKVEIEPDRPGGFQQL